MKLCYYGIRGLAQPIRNLLFYLKTQFEDQIILKNTQNDIECGFNLGLPCFIDQYCKIHGQIGILTYLCDKLQCKNLLGLTPQHQARVSETLFKYSVQHKKLMTGIVEGVFKLQQSLNKQTSTEIILKKLINQCKFLEYCLKACAKTKKFVMGYLTLIDFIYYEICVYIDGFFGRFISTDTTLLIKTIEFKQNFELSQFYIKNSVKIEGYNLFFPFSNQNDNEILSQYWKGKAKIIAVK